MPKRSSKKQAADEVQAAQRTIANIAEKYDPPDSSVSAAAAALGRLGGLKGGPARAAKLSARKRSEIAKKAAVARWKK